MMNRYEFFHGLLIISLIYRYFKLQLLDASNPRLTVSKQRNAITQQLIDNLIKGLLQTMPYASNISIAVLDDNVLEVTLLKHCLQ